MADKSPASLLVDSSGRILPVLDGAAIVAENPALFLAGIDSLNQAKIIRLNGDGIFVSPYEEPTYYASLTEIATANNKSMFSIAVANLSTAVVKIRSIHIVNSQNTAVTGVVCDFQLRRFVSHSVGTDFTANIEEGDLNNTLSADVTVRTGATIVTESTKLIRRAEYSTDEWGAGGQDVESMDHVMSQLLPLYVKQDPAEQPLTIRGNQGVHVKCATNTTTGFFDIHCVFTQV